MNNLENYFQEKFNQQPLIVVAPARINLIGEHTDYNDGYSLPAAIDKAIWIAISKSDLQSTKLVAVDLNEEIALALEEIAPSTDWSTYFKGVVFGFRQKGFVLKNMNVAFNSNIPLGAGLSSSAALSCGFAFAINELLEFGLSKLELAKIAQQAEHIFAGVKCGLMDQYASLFGKKDCVILLDCKELTHQYFPLSLNEHTLLLIDTKVKHSLASSAYNKRRESCEEGVAIMQKKYPTIKSLRDVNINRLLEFHAQLSEETFKRCSYVITEIKRTQMATTFLNNFKLEEFGKLMYETHKGLRHDYEVSCEESDFLVSLAMQHGVAGARQMGGGFGGCTINLIQSSKVEEFKIAVKENYFKKFKAVADFYDVTIEDGVHRLKK